MDDTDYLSESVRYHDLAMEQADQAHIARRKGNTDAYLKFTYDSFVNEAKAAQILRQDRSHHMYAILHRSAATLAYRCGEFGAAENLILEGLKPRPNDRLRNELYDLLRKVLLHETREHAYPPLVENEIIVTLTGVEADNGELEAESNATIITDYKQLLRTFTGVVLKFPFHELRKFDENYRVLTAVPAKGSFRISMKLIEVGQLSFSFLEDVENVFDKVIESLDNLRSGDTPALEESLGDEDYFHHFMQLARNLAPDGEHVNAYSVEANIKGEPKSVVFDRTTDEIDKIYSPPQKVTIEEVYQVSSEIVTLSGTVLAADGKKDTDQVEFYDDEGIRWSITVPENLGESVVRPHFELRSEITAHHRFVKKKSNRLELISIRSLSSGPSDSDQPLLPRLSDTTVQLRKTSKP